MKTKQNSRKLIVFIIIIYSFSLNAQNITSDTILAKKLYEDAYTGLKSRNFQHMDSFIVSFTKAAEIFNKHKVWNKYLETNCALIECYARKRKLTETHSLAQIIIKKAKQHFGESNAYVGTAWHNLGLCYSFNYKPDSSIIYYKKGLEIRLSFFGENNKDVAWSYNNIGLAYAYKYEYNTALNYILKSLDIRIELFGEKHTSVAASYNNIGLIHNYRNEHAKALKYYLKALLIKKELIGENNVSVAYSYLNIGNVYDDMNEPDLTLQYYFKVLRIRKNLYGEEHAQIASNYNDIGVVYRKKNDYAKALEYFFKSSQIYKNLNQKELVHNIAMLNNNIGICYMEKKEPDLALEYYSKALKVFIKLYGEDNIYASACYCNIGIVYQNIKKYDLAIQNSVKDLNITKKLFGDYHPDVAISYNNVADIYLEKKEYSTALQYFQKGISANLRSFKDTLNIYSVPVIKDYLNWSELLISLKSKAEIFVGYSLADLRKKEGRKVSRLKSALSHYQACDTLISKVRREMKTKSDKISLGEKANEVYKGAVEVCKHLIKLSLDSKNNKILSEMAFYFSEKNKSSVLLESLAGAEAQKFAGIPDTLLKLESILQNNMGFYKKTLAEDPDSITESLFKDKLFNTNRSYDSLILVFENKYPEYHELKYNQKPVSFKQVSNILDKKTAILSYFTGDSTITIFIIKQTKLYHTSVTKPIDFEKKMEILRYNISDPIVLGTEVSSETHKSVDVYQKSAHEIYKILFPPEVKNILGEKTENLIIIPDKKLSTLPFEALHTNSYEATWTGWKNTNYFSEMPYLVKNYNISYSYSANLFYKTFNKTHKQNKIEISNLNDWLAFAPVFDNENISGTALRTRKLLQKYTKTSSDSLKTRAFTRDGKYISELPGSLDETKSIFKLYENQNKKALLKTHALANEDFAKSGELSKYKYLHFATHGIVNEVEPELSGLLLAQDTTSKEDNILYTGEIYNLKLNTDLTVLSACETGLGKITEGEGVIGLTRALLYAGSKNIIVSLWQVSDASTNKLMVDFYTNFLNEKSPMSQNYSKHLRNAKLKLIEEGKYAHPFFWSPFILIGR